MITPKVTEYIGRFDYMDVARIFIMIGGYN